MILKNRKLVFAGVTALLLVVVFILPASLSRKGKQMVRGGVTPVERGTSGLGQRLSEAIRVIRGMGGAVEKNRDLLQEQARMQVELDRLEDVEEENLRLRRAFKFYRQQPLALIPCEVLSRDISGWWHSVRIGKGRSDGVHESASVISPDGLVGKVLETAEKTAEVLLVCDPACRVSAKIKRTNTFGLIRGGGVNLRGHPIAYMDFIDKDVEVRAGDEVVTSGLSGNGTRAPRGVHIGYIVKVQRDESGLYQSAELAPSATVSLLDYLFVVSDAGKEQP